MPKYLCATATFLTGRFHGNEWPPSPARFFQALLAGAQTGINQKNWAEVQPALRLLEALPAPEILAAKPHRAPSYRISIPNNDMDKAAREWIACRSFDVAKLRTLKEVSPRVFAESPSHFHICYLWEMDGSVPLGPFQRLASFLHTFGLGVDMAYANAFLLEESDRKRIFPPASFDLYRPASKGTIRNIPAEGYLEDLINSYRLKCVRQSSKGVDPSIRARGYGQERYQQVGKERRLSAQFFLRQLDRIECWYSVPWATGMKVAAWLRHAAAEALREEGFQKSFIDSYVLGHGDGHTRHMSFVPVPTISTARGDGAIRRAMLVEPSGSDGTIAELLQWKLAPSLLRELVDGGPPRPVCCITEADDRDYVFRCFGASSSQWHSVTPVVLHGYNTEHRKFSPKKTERLIIEAFEESGCPVGSLSDFSFQPAPLWTGTGGAPTIRVPEHLKKWPRYHVAVRFKYPVTGPILAGIGRHYGLGLFAAPSERRG